VICIPGTLHAPQTAELPTSPVGKAEVPLRRVLK
jgi:hypothetical protein